MAEDPNPRAQIGDNKAPEVDPFLQRLDEANTALQDEETDLALELRRLPAVAQTEEDVGLINSWVTRSRALAKKIETKRIETKAPYLEREKQIDGWFGKFRERLVDKAKDVEKRNGPFLLAKQKAEEERRRAEAERLRREAEEKRVAAEAARKAEEEARKKREVEEENLREQERQRQAALRGETKPEPAAAPSAAETAYRGSLMGVGAASKATEKAEEEARKAELAATRAAAKAEGPALGKVQGGGANAKAEMVWVGRVKSHPAVLQTLGPLGPFFNEAVIQDAVNRAAKAKVRPEVPGVEFYEELAVKTTATRS